MLKCEREGVRRAQVVEARSPVTLRKSVKNGAELAGMREAHLRDAEAIVQFLHWLDDRVRLRSWSLACLRRSGLGQGPFHPSHHISRASSCPCRGGAVEPGMPGNAGTAGGPAPGRSGAQIAGGDTVTEVEVHDRLTARRKAQPGFVDCSFPTIAGTPPPHLLDPSSMQTCTVVGRRPPDGPATAGASLGGCGGWRGSGSHGAPLHQPCLHCAALIAPSVRRRRCRPPPHQHHLLIITDRHVAVRAAREGGWRAAGEGPNGAIIHYRAAAPGCGTVTQDSHLLIDSGGQYDVGTTDVPPALAARIPLHRDRPPAGLP